MSPEQFLQIADLYPDPSILLTKEGVVVAANRSTAALGTLPKNLLGRTLTDLVATPPNGVRDYLHRCLQSREPVAGSLSLRLGTEQEVPCQCYGSALAPDSHGGETHILLRIIRESTAPDRLAALTRKIDQLTEEIQQSQQVQEELREVAEKHRAIEEHLTALVEASRTLTYTLESHVVSSSILNLSRRLVPADAYAVWRLHPHSGHWQIVASSGLSDSYRRESIRVLEQTPGMPGSPVIADDVFTLPMLENRREVYRKEGIRSLLALPLRLDDEVRGTLSVYHRQPHSFSEIEVRVATALANLAAAAIYAADLYEDQARLHAETQEHKERLRVTLASIGDAVIATDAEGRATFLNPVAEALTGWTMAEAHGRNLDEIFRIVNEHTRKAVENPVHRVLREGAVAGLANHTVLIAKDGREVPIDDSGAPIRTAEGRVAGAVLTFRDVSERRQAEKALRRSEQDARFLADASAALAGLVDFESTLQKIARLAVPTFADWCAVDMLDDSGALKRLAVAHVDPSKVELAHELHRRFPPDPAAPTGVWNVLRTGKSEIIPEITDEMLVARVQDAERLRIARELGLKSYMSVPLVLRGRVMGVITFIAAESGRRYGTVDLCVVEDLANRAAVAIENARLYQAVREADRRKDEFLALLGHELRNPLAPIRNALNVLKLPGADAAVILRAREMMERQVEHMVRLVDDLLDVSRIMRGKVELRREPVELATVVARAVETTLPIIETEGHLLTVELPPEPLWVNGDLVRLAQVASNLLNNAAKYTERGGQIWLTAQREGGEAVLRVRDTGIGIAPEFLPRLFDMFFQGERRTKESQGGLGIGLPLVRGLVELHGGAIVVHSGGPGKGSEFVVRLPLLATKEDKKGPRSSSATKSLSPRRVLVVDDNVDAADSLAMLLRLQGQEVQVAYDAASALAQAEADPPAIAFLDLGMPKMDGYELARAFRNHPALREVVLIALTGWGQPEDRQRTKEAGFDHHLVKPVEEEALHGLLGDGARDDSG
jgi:PAS domain S-box-containing protein